MFDGLTSRTPIYTRKLDVFGYELRFCSATAVRHGIRDDEEQFSDCLMTATRELNLDDLVGPNRALISLPTRALSLCDALAWPRDRLVLAIPEPDTKDEGLRKAVGQLAARGFTIALRNPSHDPSALSGVSICALDAGAKSNQLPAMAAGRKRPHLMVRRLETAEQYEYFHGLDFDYYEGDYFNHPRLLHGVDIPANRLAVLQLLTRLQDSNVEIREVEDLVSRDITLSYKLLRLLNAAYFGMPRRVDSIRRAVMFFGLQRVKNWATVILVNAIDFRPRELLTIAMVRARFCELIAQDLGRTPSEPYYMAGLFSLLDAIIDAPMAEIVQRLNLSDALTTALLTGQGPIGEVLRCTLAIERADVTDMPCRDFSRDDLPTRAYLDAIRWAQEATRQITMA